MLCLSDDDAEEEAWDQEQAYYLGRQAAWVIQDTREGKTG